MQQVYRKYKNKFDRKWFGFKQNIRRHVFQYMSPETTAKVLGHVDKFKNFLQFSKQKTIGGNFKYLRFYLQVRSTWHKPNRICRKNKIKWCFLEDFEDSVLDKKSAIVQQL